MEAKQHTLNESQHQSIPEKREGLPRVPTGIEGLDEVLGGGFPGGRSVLVLGGQGVGKSIFLSQFLIDGVLKHGEPGVLVTFEETRSQIEENLRGLGWDLGQLIEDGSIALVFIPPERTSSIETGNVDWLGALAVRIDAAASKVKAKRVGIDSLGSYFGTYAANSQQTEIRHGMYRLFQGLKEQRITTVVTSEAVSGASSFSRHGVEEFVADGVISLQTYPGQNSTVRTMMVEKMRGISYRSGAVVFTIGAGGILVYPKIPVDTSHAATNFQVRFSMGIEDLDHAMGGGLPQGHMLMVAGNTGTGKSLLGMHFADAGIKNDETVVWVALEEPVPQVLKTANAHGFEFEEAKREGKLHFVTSSLLDIVPDRLLYDIVRTVSKANAKRVVIDSVSSLESGAFNREQVRDFLIQAAGYFKTRGLCCTMNYLTAETFGASQGMLLGGAASNSMRLSSIVDGIILLRYVERNQGVQKLLNILKLRGSTHARDILQYEISNCGLQLGTRFGIR